MTTGASDGAARRAALVRSARLSLGTAVVVLLFLGETIVAHHIKPNEASPMVWTALGTIAAVALLRAAWLHRQAARLDRAQSVPPPSASA